MLDNNLKVEFDTMNGKKVCFIQDKPKDCRIVAKTQGVGKMFLLDVVASSNQALNVCVVDVTTLWH